MDVFVARQPIFNRHRRLFAYELLFRDGISNAFPEIDGSTATSSLLSSSFFTFGLEQIVSGHKAFINFTEDMLVRGFPTLFPARMVVVELLENIPPTDEVVSACLNLVNRGYTLALDDFVYDRAYTPLLKIVGIVKVDLQSTSNEQVRKLAGIVKEYRCKLLAEKIETYEEYTQALEMGFSYFQGYFFAHPEVLKNRELSSAQMTYMRLIIEINRAEFDVTKLETIIKQDVAISYKLLKYLNSAYYSRLQPISSIRQAIAYLGERGTKMFVSLIATGRLAENKPDELIRTSSVRARFLELLARELQQDQGTFFLLGLFSLLDAMLDAPMEGLIRQLPVSDEIIDALVNNGGPLFPYLQLIELYESGRWQDLDQAVQNLNLDGTRIADFYVDAVHWSGFFI